MAAADSPQTSVKQALRQSGLLFQGNPDIEGWKTTRPGALHAEVVAFTNKEVTPQFDRLGIRYYRAGERDPCDYKYDEETWVVEIQDRGDYSWEEEEMFTDRDEMIDHVVEVMQDVAENRQTTDEN